MFLDRRGATLSSHGGYQAPMPFPKLSTALLGCLLAVVFAAPASAYSSFELGIHEADAASSDDGRYDAIRDANADLARLTVYWAQHVPGGTEKPAGFDARNPADPNYNWTSIDNFVRAMSSRGVDPFITILQAPPWAEGDDAADRANRFGNEAGVYRPNAKEFGDFMFAMATRYSGSFKDAAGNTLPRVTHFQIWNEPNFGQYLLSRRQSDIPLVYLKLLNAGYDAVKSVSKSNLVIAAGFGPFGNNQNATDVEPQVFMRSIMCLTGRGGQNLRDKKSCKTPKPKFDVWAQHPYTFGGTPTTRAGNPDSAALGDMPEIRRTLDFAVKSHNLAPSGRKGLWVTEFGWFADPPGVVNSGRQIGLPPAKQAAYLSETAFRLWKLRFGAMMWYGLHDRSANEFPTGLYQGQFPGAKARPALDAFHFPFYADAGSRGVLFWGLAHHGGRTTVRIERQVGNNWKRLADVRTDGQGMFYTRIRAKKANYRARALNGAKSGLTSQPFRAR
jgi:hypothetical protein